MRYVAAVGPEDAGEVRDFERLGLDGVWGFSALAGGGKLMALFNPADEALGVSLPLLGQVDVYRGQAGPEALSPAEGKVKLDLEPRSLVLVKARGV